jgi:hypothetical protein
MKKLLALATILFSFTSLAQYEEEIKLLNKACSISVDSLDSLFSGFEVEEKGDTYMYADYENDKYYVVDYSEGNAIASYVETYNRYNLKAMKSSVKNASDGYHYLVSSFKNINAILISSTKDYGRVQF